MVFARVAEYLTGSESQQHGVHNELSAPITNIESTITQDSTMANIMIDDEELEEPRPPYAHAMLAGGIGGTMGDMLMHSLDTVKTRQQGDPHMPPKYTSMGSTYGTIWKQEGFARGLYGGVLPAFLGSFSGTVIFFGVYEWSKRYMVDHGVAPSLAYFSAGFLADFAASPLYVPSEVLKTRLQLQGRYNNPHFNSGYNYKSTAHALRTIIKKEGLGEMFSGYKATLSRDLPFSALQFAFYEKEQRIAKAWCGNKDIGLPLEIFTGASAGGMAGVITCPLDVVKTRIQTQLDPALIASVNKKSASTSANASNVQLSGKIPSSNVTAGQRPAISQASGKSLGQSLRQISTSGASTSLRHHGSVTLDTESVIEGLRAIYRAEGMAGWFRGVGPRGVWTSIQSGTMLVAYQSLLKWFDAHPLSDIDGS